MKQFYQTQKSKGMNLLFIAAVGDNYYVYTNDNGERI